MNKISVASILILISIAIPVTGQELARISLDDPESIGLQIASDPVVKVEGKNSMRVTTLWPTTICLGQVSGIDVENAKLVYRAKIKTEIQGTAYLEMWVNVNGGSYFSRGMNDTVSGKSNWKTIQTPFTFQNGQKPEKVTLNLIVNGTGTVWIDDVVLMRESL